MAISCDDLKTKYLELASGAGVVLIKSGDQLVKYTDAAKLLEVIERLCGPIIPEGSTAQRGVRMHGNRVSDPGDCGCSSPNGWNGWD